MSFIRVLDGAALDPVMVYGPYVQDVESRNQVATLLESSETTVAYFPTTRRSGDFLVLFHSYEDADAARNYFGAGSLFDFLGPATTPGEYIVSGGRIVLSAGEADPALSLRFAVRDAAMRVEQDEVDEWTLSVPYREVS